MPEGHSLARLARDQQELVGQGVQAWSPQGRFADGAAAVDGRVLEAVEAAGKHLLQRVGPDTVHVHLGMRGTYLRSEAPLREPLRQVRLRLATGEVAWDLVAPSTCELLDDAGVEALLARLGPDPLKEEDPGRFVAALAGEPRPLGVALLDQSVVAGVGNVFRAEALFARRLHPERRASSLGPDEAAALWTTLRSMMATAVDDGRIITVDVPDGSARLDVPEAEARRVYKRERCAECGAAVATWTLGGRTAYACPVQQAV